MLASIQKRLYKKSGLHFFLVLLLVGVFVFLRSFDLVVLQPYLSQGKTAHTVSLIRPAGSADLDFILQHGYLPADQELEALEEEEAGHTSPCVNTLSALTASAVDLQVYSRILEHRRQQQHLSLQQRSSIPYFILFHCWKSFLS